MERLGAVISRISGADVVWAKKARERLDRLTKPQGSLGRLEDLAARIVSMTGRMAPRLSRKVIFVCAADHGVVAEGVSAYPQEVTAQMVLNFLKGGAAINVLARAVKARVVVADVGVCGPLSGEKGLIHRRVSGGTENMARGPAMTRAQAIQAVEAGMDIFERQYRRGVDLCGTGDMGIGNTTASAAIAAALLKKKAADVVGTGTGLDSAGLARKIRVVEAAIAVNKPDSRDPLDVLAKVGGFEIGALSGIMLAAARRKVPVVVDGFISTAAALVAWRIAPPARDYFIASHLSTEQGHRLMLEALDLKPLLALDLRLGEGTGAALAMPLVEAAIKLINGMATFDQAGVSEKKSQETA